MLTTDYTLAPWRIPLYVARASPDAIPLRVEFGYPCEAFITVLAGQGGTAEGE
jgi:hypothetical protein